MGRNMPIKKIASLTFTLTLFIFATMLSCSQSSDGGSASSTPSPGGTSGSGGGGGADTVAPTVGTAISFANVQGTTLTVNWGFAVDSGTSLFNLQYRLVKATTSSAIDTIAEVDAIPAGADLLQDYTANDLTQNVTGLTGSTTYFFAVVVRDTAGNKSLYVPASTTTLAVPTATRVYGQHGSFLGNSVNPGGPDSLNIPYGIAADAGGVYVVDQMNNRVLYFAGTSTTATRVYGQRGNLYGNAPNGDGVSADSLNQPSGVAVDAGGVYIADRTNNRVLYYAGTSTTATRVYGQGGFFTTNIQNYGGRSAISLSGPNSVAVDAGGVYIVDRFNHRVLYYAGTSTTATRVYGQAGNFTTSNVNSGGVSADTLFQPLGAASDAGGVYIADGNNNRVLYFAGTSTTATRVYGQGGTFTTNSANGSGVTANSLQTPGHIAVEAGGIYIADYANHRVLYFAGTSTTATRVYGQGGIFTTANGGGAASANNLYYPNAVAVTASGVLVTDGSYHRALYFAGTSTTATRVYGQGGSFTASAMNSGSVNANSMFGPTGIAVDAGGTYVADLQNHRVLYFSGTSTTATRVYGQAGSFVTTTANTGGISANSLNSPTGIALDAGGVYIADTYNNRVLYFAGTSTTATRVYGQAGNYTTSTVNNGGLSATSLSTPEGIAVDAGGIYVVDSGNHRVLYYAGTSTTATRVYGQGGSFTTGTGNNGGVSSTSLQLPQGVAADANGVYIADRNNHRVLYFAGTATTATRVYGQGGSFTQNTCNNGNVDPTANTLCSPRSIAIDAGGIYIADEVNNRALFFPGTATTPTKVYGQLGNFTSKSSNASGTTAATLSYASGVAIYGSNLYITDYSNNRCLMY